VFKGDTAAFANARSLLDSCLLGRQTQKPERGSKAFFAVAAAALLLLIGLAIFFSARSRRRWDHLVDRLRQEPGIVLTSANRSWGSYEFVGLRDPLSTDPDRLIRASGIDPARVTSRWEPYVSLDAKFKVYRQFLTEKAALEQAVLRFPLNSFQLSPEQLAKLDDVEANIVKLQQDGAAIGQKFMVELHGHADPTGNESKNDELSARRAQAVEKALVSRGISNDMFRTVGMGSREPVRRATAAYLTELNRRVTFHVISEKEAVR
jgi:OOP family OmpA-OmpF porin